MIRAVAVAVLLGGRVWFSPGGGASDAICQELLRARQQVRVLAYSFTSQKIACALSAARRRGVDVQIVVDGAQRGGRYTADVVGVTELWDDRHAIQHNKVMVIDQRVVITGSFNFSRAADEKNAENLLIVEDVELAARYLLDWELHRQHSSARPPPRK